MKGRKTRTHKRMKKNNYSISIKLWYIVIAALITTSFSMARYKTSVAGDLNSSTAKWSFKVNGDATEKFTINLAQTAEDTNLFSKAAGIIAPGGKGKFQIELDFSECQTAFEYTIKLSTNPNSEMPREFVFYNPSDKNIPVINTPYPDGTWPEERVTKGTKTIEDIKNNPKITCDVAWMWQVNKDRNESEFEGKDFFVDATVTIKQQI